MKTKEIKKLTDSELKNKLNSLKKDLFNLRFKKVNSQLTNPSLFKQTKKSIARIKTLIGNK